jgi:site-specific DNA recombinase
MRVAIDGRVSTSHQVDHQTLEQPLERLTAHVRAHAAEDWALNLAHVFRDDGYSGAVLARPGLDRLRDAVKAREVDRVLVTAPDRLARNYVHQMVLLEEWAKAGCAAEFLDRPMSDDPHDHLLLQIRGAVAEYERTLIAERMRRGRIAKLRAGLLLPWTYPPYGYRLSPDRPRDPRGVTTDPAEAAVVAELFALYREPGTSLMQLAMPLDARGVPTPSGRPRGSSDDPRHPAQPDLSGAGLCATHALSPAPAPPLSNAPDGPLAWHGRAAASRHLAPGGAGACRGEPGAL